MSVLKVVKCRLALVFFYQVNFETLLVALGCKLVVVCDILMIFGGKEGVLKQMLVVF